MKNINELNYLSVKAISPEIKLGDILYNSKVIIDLIKQHSDICNLLVFPELCLTGATCGDRFLFDELINQIDSAINNIVEATAIYASTVIIGTPLKLSQQGVATPCLINCAILISDGKIIGIVPKQVNNRWFSYFPNFDNSRGVLHTPTFEGRMQYAPTVKYQNSEIPISENIIFNAKIQVEHNGIYSSLHTKHLCKVGICVGTPNINSAYNLQEADVLVSIDAKPFCVENRTISELKYLSKFTKQGIIYVNANANESTTDKIFDGLIVVAENGNLIKEMNCSWEEKNLAFETSIISVEIDIDIIQGARKRELLNSENFSNVTKNSNTVNISFELPFKFDLNFNENSIFERYFDSFPTDELSEGQILKEQALGLAKRLKSTGIKSVVIGISGGIDSTLALLVCEKCFEILKLDKKNIYAISMPGLGTSENTKELAKELADTLEVTFLEIPINDAVRQHFKDIHHDENDKNIVYENSQARMRTMILFDYANKVGGLVVGTGDMSEIALGWSTFNADHISNYNVNCGVPKTVAKDILKYYWDDKTYEIRKKIRNSPISPELLPPDEEGNVQSTEKIIGSYKLHDFFLYYHLGYFFSKEKLLFVAKTVFEKDYSEEEIEKTLDIFMKRFYANQFKRNCMPDGPNIFNFSLSPRGGLILPSDNIYLYPKNEINFSKRKIYE